MEHTIKTRFAPSPTGFLHIGGLRTALYNYLFAKKNNGKVILRIEDTDIKRYVKGAVENLLKTLNNVNLNFDEGIILKGNKLTEVGDNKSYYQSKRLKIYQNYIKQLLDNNNAYYCFCFMVRLARMRQEQLARKEAPKYDGHCRNLEKDKVLQLLKKKTPYVIRLKVPENKTIEFKDLIYGEIKVNSKEIDDQILIKSDGFPTYHLANVIDDYLMGITHVIRGEEWLPSTPKHIILYQAFGWLLPFFVHLPLIVNPQKQKLSKRQGDVAVEDFLKKGYLPEALINYIAFLGWNPKDEREFFTLTELINEFSLEKINRAPAVFDLKKLQWFNSYYIKKLPISDLIEKCKIFINKKIKDGLLERIVSIEQPRLNTLAEIGEGNEYFFQEPKYPKELLIFKKSNLEKTTIGLNKSIEILETIKEENWQKENLIKILKEIVEKNKIFPGDVYWPIRVGLSGKEQSPSPEELLWLFGKKESLKRVKKAVNYWK